MVNSRPFLQITNLPKKLQEPNDPAYFVSASVTKTKMFYKIDTFKGGNKASGATTLSITTFSITTSSITTFNITIN